MLKSAATGEREEKGMKEKVYRALSKLLILVLLVSCCLPSPHMGRMTAQAGVSTKVVEEVEELAPEILYQEVPYGTKRAKLKLPSSLLARVVYESEDEAESEQETEEESEKEETATASELRRTMASLSELAGALKGSASEADRRATDSELDGEEATPSEAEKGKWKKVKVKWVLNETFSECEKYDPETAGLYVFEAELAKDHYDLGDCELPVIEVQVLEKESEPDEIPEEDLPSLEEETGILVSGWKFADRWLDLEDGCLIFKDGSYYLPLTGNEDEAERSFDAIVSALPDELLLVIEAEDGETVEEAVSVNWECPEYVQKEDGTWKTEGEYCFTCELPEEYVLADGVEKPCVFVVFGGEETLADSPIHREKVGDVWCVFAQGTPIVVRENEEDDSIVSVYDEEGNLLSGETNVEDNLIFGGWYREEKTISKPTRVTVESGSLSAVLGGSFGANLIGSTEVIVKGGYIDMVFGGSLGEDLTGSTEVIVKGGYIDWVSGGGFYGDVSQNTSGDNSSNVRMESQDEEDTESNLSVTKVLIEDGNVDFAYGGGCYGNIYGNTSITISGAEEIGNVYGGGYLASIYGDTSVTVSDGEIATVYGGNNYDPDEDDSEKFLVINGSTSVTVSGGSLGEVYGGSDDNSGNFHNLIMENTSVTVSGGTMETVYGGGIFNGIVGNTKVVVKNEEQDEEKTGTSETIADPAFIQIVYGGGICNVIQDGTSVTVSGGQIGEVYGGGYNSIIKGISSVQIQSDARIWGYHYQDEEEDLADEDVLGSIFAGGYYDEIANTELTLDGGDYGFAYGGGFGSIVTEKASVELLETSKYPAVILGSGYGGSTALAELKLNHTKITSVPVLIGGGEMDDEVEELQISVTGELELSNGISEQDLFPIFANYWGAFDEDDSSTVAKANFVLNQAAHFGALVGSGVEDEDVTLTVKGMPEGEDVAEVFLEDVANLVLEETCLIPYGYRFNPDNPAASGKENQPLSLNTLTVSADSELHVSPKNAEMRIGELSGSGKLYFDMEEAGKKPPTVIVDEVSASESNPLRLGMSGNGWKQTEIEDYVFFRGAGIEAFSSAEAFQSLHSGCTVVKTKDGTGIKLKKTADAITKTKFTKAELDKDSYAYGETMKLNVALKDEFDQPVSGRVTITAGSGNALIASAELDGKGTAEVSLPVNSLLRDLPDAEKSLTLTYAGTDWYEKAVALVTCQTDPSQSVFQVTGAELTFSEAIPAPVLNQTPQRSLSVPESAFYTAEVIWSPETEVFQENIPYTASIRLTPKTGYDLKSVASVSYRGEALTMTEKGSQLEGVAEQFAAIPSTDPDGTPSPSPNPNPDVTPNPSPNPNPDGTPNPSPNPNPDGMPNPSPNPRPNHGSKDRSDSSKNTSGTVYRDSQKGWRSPQLGILTSGGKAGGSYSQWVQNETGSWLAYPDGTWPQGTLVVDESGTVGQDYGWELVDGSWWAFDSEGYRSNGWIFDAGDKRWYYIDESKGMQTGWYQDPQDGSWYYLDPESGAMLTGWNLIQGSWYYFSEGSGASWVYDSLQRRWVYTANGTNHSFGSLYRGETTPDGYQTGEDGSRKDNSLGW